MGEWKKTICNLWFPAVLAAAILLNILLFLGEQKAEHYRLDFSKPVSETVESVSEKMENDTYIGELSEKEEIKKTTISSITTKKVFEAIFLIIFSSFEYYLQ